MSYHHRHDIHVIGGTSWVKLGELREKPGQVELGIRVGLDGEKLADKSD